MVCGDSWKAQVANSGFFLGVLIGSGIFGWLCDKQGRFRSLAVATFIAGALTLASVLSKDFATYLVLRLLVGVGVAGERGAVQCATV